MWDMEGRFFIMIFKVNFEEYFDESKDRALNIDLDSDNKIVKDENGVVVGNISDFARLYEELYFDEENSYTIKFFLVSNYYNIDIELSDKQVVEILDGLNIHSVSL